MLHVLGCKRDVAAGAFRYAGPRKGPVVRRWFDFIFLGAGELPTECQRRKNCKRRDGKKAVNLFTKGLAVIAATGNANSPFAFGRNYAAGLLEPQITCCLIIGALRHCNRGSVHLSEPDCESELARDIAPDVASKLAPTFPDCIVPVLTVIARSLATKQSSRFDKLMALILPRGWIATVRCAHRAMTKG
ncbi:MAG: hypothetical protein JNG82_10195 [Opitutaceae bacterium]|nr:hypothetical protein [Opitutaceae bacterium]